MATLSRDAELAAGAPMALRWTKQSLNSWYRQLAGPIFDSSLALEFIGFQTGLARV